MEVLDITIGETPRDGILEILGHIRPAWTPKKIVIKSMTGGHVNQLYSCCLDDDLEENDKLVVRIYGAGLENLSDKEKEITVMAIGHSIGLAARIFCRFNNGIVYTYQKGCKVDFTNQTDEPIARGVAQVLAKLHHTDYKHVLKELGEGDKIDSFKSCFSLSLFLPKLIPAVPDSYDDIKKEEIRVKELMSKADVEAAVRRLDDAIEAMNFPLVLCHNDVNTGNILYDASAKGVNLVDWEIADLSNGINDIASFLVSHIYTLEEKCCPDHLQLFPSREYQYKYIRWYLEYTALLSGKDPEGVTEDQIQILYNGVNLAAMIGKALPRCLLDDQRKK